MEKIENSTAPEIPYSKRRDGIVKKANELSVLCDADVGLLLFSPTGGLTSFASKGRRVEDVFLRLMDRADELRGGSTSDDENLKRSLTHLKYEGEMLEKIAKIEALEEEICSLNKRQYAAQEKIRFYSPDVKKISSVHEAQVHQQYLTDAIQHIEELIEEKFLGAHIVAQGLENIEVPAVEMNNRDQITKEFENSARNWILSRDHHKHEDLSSPTGPHLSLNYFKMLSHWNLTGSGHSIN